MIWTKVLACLVQISDYTKYPRRAAVYGSHHIEARRRPMHLETVETCDTADPRLGTRIGLASPWHSSPLVAPLKVSGRAGASPHQI